MRIGQFSTTSSEIVKFNENRATEAQQIDFVVVLFRSKRFSCSTGRSVMKEPLKMQSEQTSNRTSRPVRDSQSLGKQKWLKGEISLKLMMIRVRGALRGAFRGVNQRQSRLTEFHGKLEIYCL
jgi:hypothetical protein